MRRNVKQRFHVIPIGKNAIGGGACPALRPNQIKCRTWKVFPTKYKIRTELSEIEIRITEGISIGYIVFIDSV